MAGKTTGGDGWTFQNLLGDLLHVPMCGSSLSSSDVPTEPDGCGNHVQPSKTTTSIPTSITPTVSAATSSVPAHADSIYSLLLADGTIDPKYLPEHLARASDTNPVITLHDIQTLFQTYNRTVVMPLNAKLDSLIATIGNWTPSQSIATSVTELTTAVNAIKNCIITICGKGID